MFLLSAYYSKGNPSCVGNRDGLTFKEDCCSEANQCGEGQGGCKNDNECGANTNLVCRDCDDKENFPAGAKCCQYPSTYHEI